MKYNHMQINKLGIAGLIIAAVVAIMSKFGKDYADYVPQWMDTTGWDIWAIVIITCIYLFAINMMIMQIKVSKDTLYWSFGVGFPRKEVNLSDIATIEKVTNKWWYGWGIRKVISGGWLYNVYGLQAIEIKTHAGKITRIGTDEPKHLYRVLDTLISKEEGDM